MEDTHAKEIKAWKIEKAKIMRETGPSDRDWETILYCQVW